VRRFLDELSLIPKPSSGAVAIVHRVSNQGWTPPGEGIIKANVDAAILGISLRSSGDEER
jgi:hypothetical protein